MTTQALVRPLVVDAEVVERAIAWKGLTVTLPRLPRLTRRDREAIANGDKASVARKFLPLMLARELHEQNLPAGYLSDMSYGFAIQGKGRERIAKLLGLEVLNVHVDGEVKALPDAKLIELLAALGVVSDCVNPVEFGDRPSQNSAPTTGSGRVPAALVAAPQVRDNAGETA